MNKIGVVVYNDSKGKKHKIQKKKKEVEKEKKIGKVVDIKEEIVTLY